jgi:DUF2889 family protein
MTGFEAAPLAVGVGDPMAGTPARPDGSVRRTSHVDIIRTGGGGLLLEGAARDLRTADGKASVLAEATVSAHLDPQHILARLQSNPSASAAQALVGLLVGSGFRAAVDAALPEERATSSPLYLLLDELPIAAVISGYALLYRGAIDFQQIDAGTLKADICSGWRSDGTMMVSLRTRGRMPIPVGPVANPLESLADPFAWHDIGTLPAGAMRRRRLVEITDGEPHDVYAMFRDTHVDGSGIETVLHEYSFAGELEPGSLTFRNSRARPRVLPWVECPAAAASATRLDGHAPGNLRALIGREFRGTGTCTHLNDLLRSLADLGALEAKLADR